ncbi:MAG: insulinase family protein [Alphaproteobacteria bacterium]|nr:insulinase family protein [Alphaproteobacteria bacterium]
MEQAQQAGPQVVELTPGGAQVVIDVGGAAPVSAVYLWVRAGAARETSGELGAAHLLEHMLFKGAGGHGVSEAAERIEGLGGDLNAYTSYEQMVLHATLPAGREAEVIATLAEMAFAPHLDPDELAREKGVVVEEIRGALDDPSDRLAEGLRARAHGPHPYGRPVLGTEATVTGMSAADLSAFHQRWYRPERALLVVAGPVDVDAILAAARTALAPTGRPAPVDPVHPAPVVGDRFFTIGDGFEERFVELAFPIPSLHHADIAALDLLSSALGDGDAAVLPQRLRDELGCAVDAWAALETDVDCGLFVVGALARRGRVADVVRALGEALAGAVRRGVPGGALRRARRSILASRIYDRETVDGRAHRMAWYQATHGDLDADALYEARIARTRADDMLAAAARWLDPDQAVVGAVVPGDELDAAGLEQAFRDGWRTGAGVARPPADGALVRRTLACGATVVVQPDAHAELAAVNVVGIGGMLAEGMAGLSGLWSRTVTRGAGALRGAELAAAVEDRAGILRAWRARNSHGLEARFPGADLDMGLDLLAEVLVAPRFDEDELERAREDMDESREALLTDDPGGLAWELAWQALFPGHVWGRLPLGSASSVARVGPVSLRRFHERALAGSNLVFALAGAVDPDEVCARLDDRLAGLPTGASLTPAPPTVAPAFRRTRRRGVEREQAHLVVAFPAFGHGHAQVPAMRVLEGVLSGQAGRLFTEVRERRGLAYSVDATSVEGLGGGALLISAAVDAQRVAEARRALWQVLEELVSAPVPPDELDRVRARIVDGAVLGLQRAADRASHLAAAERYGPGAEHWRERLEAPRAVTAGQLRALAGAVLRRDRCAIVEVGPHVPVRDAGDPDAAEDAAAG